MQATSWGFNVTGRDVRLTGWFTSGRLVLNNEWPIYILERLVLNIWWLVWDICDTGRDIWETGWDIIEIGWDIIEIGWGICETDLIM